MQDLKRYPIRQNETLQAWDAADLLLLQHLNSVDLTGKRILIINDQFGAISSGLKNFDITSFTDSYISVKSILLNTNGKIESLHRFDELTGVYDFVLIRLPKNMSFFEDILCHLSTHLNTNSKIICAGMVKHMAKSCFDLLQKYVGETTISLAQKKARLIFCNFEKSKTKSLYPLNIAIEGFGNKFINHSNLFSREKLDIGTRFLLEHIPLGDFKVILDLGCANGIVGIKAKKLNPKSKIIFCDESSMAIQSAKINYKNNFSDEAQFIWTNCYESQRENSLDLVICNPPFHQQTTIGDFVALQMFLDAHHTLKKGGVIRVIGNSHLHYERGLKKIFGNCERVATNKKFMIMDSVK